MRSMIAAAVILVTSAGLAAAQPAADREPTITVQGAGRVQVPPDHANLTVEVVTKGKSLDAATAAHRDRTQRAVNAIHDRKDDGVVLVRSTFRLGEVRNPPPPGPAPQRREETEYQAVTTFELKMTKLDKVDGAITALAATGFFEVRNLTFGIDEKNPGVNAARKAAVADARERASIYAEAAGVQLGNIVSIEDTEQRGPLMMAASAPMARTVQVTPPENMTLSASVTITWRITAKP
ncbi:MAG: SIMPL domain-containing protein [Pseudomonadota bacterium]